MFRAAHRSSSGALNCICSLWFIYPCDDRPLSRLSGKIFPLSRDNGRSSHGYINQRLQIQFRAPDVEPSVNSGIINSTTSCILLVFLLSHTTMHGSMNIKSILRSLSLFINTTANVCSLHFFMPRLYSCDVLARL
jgi:hypothetical protein